MLYIITWTYLHIGTKRDELCLNTFPQTYIHSTLLPTNYTYTCLTQSQTAAISICTQNILPILDFNNTTTLISQLVLKVIVRWSYFWIPEIFCLKVENSMREESFLPFVAIGKIYLYCFKYWLLKVFVSQKVNKYNLIC